MANEWPGQGSVLLLQALAIPGLCPSRPALVHEERAEVLFL